mgnify:CR=1 FL=1
MCGLDMKKILLFSDDKQIFEITKQEIERIGKENELAWRSFDQLAKNMYSYADVVIMHFAQKKIERGAFDAIVKVKGKLGHSIPILAIVEGGTRQDIFSILKIGAYDYIERVNGFQNYQKKIEELLLWNWYLGTCKQIHMEDDKKSTGCVSDVSKSEKQEQIESSSKI